MSNQVYGQIRDALAQLGTFLLDNQIASATSPSPEAFQSDQPFCMDSMSFEDWLYYVFIPRMHAILDQGMALPETCAIKPMAEEVFKQSKTLDVNHIHEILNMLEKLDELITNH